MTLQQDPLFDEAFAADLAAGAQYADTLIKHVTGRSRVRRAALQTLQAIAKLDFDTLQPLLAWAQLQEY